MSDPRSIPLGKYLWEYHGKPVLQSILIGLILLSLGVCFTYESSQRAGSLLFTGLFWVFGFSTVCSLFPKKSWLLSGLGVLLTATTAFGAILSHTAHLR